jgi:hypothetical protein
MFGHRDGQPRSGIIQTQPLRVNPFRENYSAKHAANPETPAAWLHSGLKNETSDMKKAAKAALFS